MAIFTIGKLLDRVEMFENRLTIFYAAVRDQSKDNGAKLLIYYLVRHRKHQQQVLENFKKSDITLARRIKIRDDISFTPDVERQLLQVNPRSINGKTLLAAAMVYDAQLAQFYGRILKAPLNPTATSLIKSLIRLEQRHKLMLKKLLDMKYF